MNTKQDIAENWLQRYTGVRPEEMSGYILLTNFNKYVDIFCDFFKIPYPNYEYSMRTATTEGITIINFGMGSPNAALIMDLLGSIKPRACLFLGKCGGISQKTQVGDFILPIAAIRGEGTSHEYLPAEIPSLPYFMLEKAISDVLHDSRHDYWSGSIFTTNRRFWEFDEQFKEYLLQTRAIGIDMETATLFTVGFYNHIPTGALLLVSDTPIEPEGIKTGASDNAVTQNFARLHIQIGIRSLQQIINGSNSLELLKYYR